MCTAGVRIDAIGNGPAARGEYPVLRLGLRLHERVRNRALAAGIGRHKHRDVPYSAGESRRGRALRHRACPFGNSDKRGRDGLGLRLICQERQAQQQ